MEINNPGDSMIDKSSRTRNTVLNLLSAYGGEVIGLLLAFTLRTVFVKYLKHA